MRRFSLLLFFCTLLFTGVAQVPVDSLPAITKRPAEDTAWAISNTIPVTSTQFVKQALLHHPYFGFNSSTTAKPVSILRQVSGKETLFYLLLFLFILFGTLRQLFPKYFGDLFRLFFRTTLKQKQIREQLLQTPLPSLALNGFFIITASLYITFLLQHYKLIAAQDFWKIVVYTGIALSIIYFAKFIGIRFSGWLFGMHEAASAYVFIVFIVNKMIGIFMFPFLLMLAFSVDSIYTAGLTLSWCMLAGLFSYRILLTYSATRNQIKVNPFHFFLYLLAFEVAPLLLIYKGLLLYFG